MLKEFHVIGKASPEGYYQQNLQLAQKRMQRIQQEVVGVLPHAVAERVYQTRRRKWLHGTKWPNCWKRTA